jgi:cell wall-associated hydrolase
MGKKLNYTKLTILTPLIMALVTPNVALADVGKVETPATFASAEAPQNVSTATPSSANDYVDPNNTQVVELTPEQRTELKNMYIDLGDGSSMDVLSIQNMQNESAKKAQARGKAMDKLFSGIISTRDELAAKVDAEKKSEEEARAKKVAEEQRQQAEAAAKKADTEKKHLQAEAQQTATATPATNTATVAPQSQTQKKYTPAVAANTATPTYTSNFDVRVDKGSNVDTSVDTSKVDAKRAGIIKTAQTGIGGAYIWGGKTFRAWDCSGFVSWVFAQHGVKLTAYTFSMVGELKPTSNPQPGDIVFQNGYNHVGIYLGNGQMISALNPSEGTIIHSVSVMPVDGYYTAL